MKIFKTSIALLCAAAVSACTFPEKAENPLMPKRFSYANEETQLTCSSLSPGLSSNAIPPNTNPPKPAPNCLKAKDMSVLKIFLTKRQITIFSKPEPIPPAVGAPGK